MSELQARLMEAFQIEYREHLACIRAVLPGDGGEPLERPPVDEIFRRAHSLKGAARAVGLAPVERLAHALESLFAMLRDGALELSPARGEAVEAGLSAIEDEVAFATGRAHLAPDSGAAVAALDAARGSAHERGRDDHDRGGGARAGRDRAQSGAGTAPVGQPLAPAPAVGPSGDASVRLPIEQLDRLLRDAERLRAESLSQAALGASLEAVRADLAALHREWDRLRTDGSLPIRRLRERPEYKGVVRFLDSFGQRVQQAGRRTRAARQAWHDGALRLHALASDLQATIGAARLVPARAVFEGFAPLLRDLARGEGKSVRIEASGLDEVADRRVLQALKDPVMHMLRNCVSHGVEPAAERRARGKPATATVRLRIATAGGRLRIEVGDDGRGLDLAAVREAATARDAGAARDLADADEATLAQQVFLPGLSTAGAVSDLSGRGMGLSVVREAARALQGEAQVVGWGGEGFVLSLEVPASVTLQHLLLVRAGAHRFALPAHAIAEVRRIRTDEIGSLEGVPAIEHAGSRIPLAPLAQLVGAVSEPVRSEAGRIAVAVLKLVDERLAIAVDRLDGELDTLVRPLGIRAGEAAERCAGVVLAEDGEVVVVLNPPGLLAQFRRASGACIAFREAAGAAPLPPLVLVVDDSFTTRTLEKSLLEAHGYRVMVATDGLDALGRLRMDRPDLVLTDLEMPRLDGYRLIERIKRDPDLREIPVVIVTSVESSVERRRGLELGADAYVVKRGFDQRSLLETMERLL